MVLEQASVWDREYDNDESFFGESPSLFCVRSAETFKKMGGSIILELGPGQGRDTRYLLDNGFNVIGMDFSSTSCSQLRQKFGDRMTVMQCDLREWPGLPRCSIDGCYAHMLLTMDFTDEALKGLIDGVYESLMPGGTFIFSVRNTNDRDFGEGQEIRNGVWKNPKGINVRYFSDEEIRSFCERFDIVMMNEFSEGNKVLYGITAVKPADQ